MNIDDIAKMIHPICEEIEKLPIDEQVNILNRVRAELHKISPFRDEPIDYVEWVKADDVLPNDYNPNHVAPPEMELLYVSVLDNGYTQPVVTWPKENNGTRHVVDGEHRTRVGRERSNIRKRLHGYLPVTIVRSGREDEASRRYATIQHNRARGKSGVDLVAKLVKDLLRLGQTDDEIARALGMSAEEVLRLKQQVKVADIMANAYYTKSWEIQK